MTHWLFWGSLAGILYVYIGFPLLVLVRSFWRRPFRQDEVTPRLSLIIVAHNEASVIRDKLENALALDYPPEKLEIVVASDGSDDGTNGVVASYREHGVRLLVCPRRGKIPALNDAVAQATGEVLVFSDANSIYDPDALRMLVRPFADSSVGGVAGNQCYLDDGAGGTASLGERAYWSFDRMLKSLQSEAGSVIGSTGAIHAIRRELFTPVPLGVCDDFAISTGVVRRGFRLVFEPNAIAREPVAPCDGSEFRRKTRVAARGLRTLWLMRTLFNPLRHGFYALQILSHKLLRYSACWMLLALLGASVALHADQPEYGAALLGQLILYGFALGGLVLRHARLASLRIYKLLAIPYYFCLANTAVMCAWLQVMRGRRVDRWSSQRHHARLRVENEAAT